LLKFAKNPSAHAKLLADAARSDPNREFRIAAASELIAQGKKQALEQQSLLKSDDFMMRSIAAMTMARMLGDQTPPEAVAILKEAFQKVVKDPSVVKEYNHFRVDSVMGEASFLAHIVMALGAIRSAEAMAMIPELCRHIDDVDGLSAETYGQGLLRLALGNGKKPLAKHFLAVLETLAESEKFYTFINVNDVLDRWRLPHNVKDLKTLVIDVKSARNPEETLRQRLRAVR
jgi:HEAT repeat protein